MKTLTFVLLLLLTAGSAIAAPRTMRLDYYHTGNATRGIFSVDRVVMEPLEWPGDPNKGIDDTNLGKYFFEVRDQKTQASAVLTRIRFSLRRVGNHRRSAEN